MTTLFKTIKDTNTKGMEITEIYITDGGLHHLRNFTNNLSGLSSALHNISVSTEGKRLSNTVVELVEFLKENLVP